MKKILALALSLLLCLTLAACSSAPAEDEAAMEETAVEETAATEEEAAPADDTVDSVEAEEAGALTDWPTLLTNGGYTNFYMGVTDAGEGAVLATDAELTQAVLGIADPTNGNSASFVGAVTTNDAQQMTITDEYNGLQITFTVTQNDDGTYTLDVGDAGVILVADCTIDDAAQALTSLEQTNAIA